MKFKNILVLSLLSVSFSLSASWPFKKKAKNNIEKLEETEKQNVSKTEDFGNNKDLKIEEDTLCDLDNSSLICLNTQPKEEVEAFLSKDTVTCIDTINTDDKFQKILIYNDKTWEYYDLGHPTISGDCFDEYWDMGEINVYKNEIPLSQIPDSVDILLADSLHGAHVPYKADRISSRYHFRYSRPHNGIDLPLKVGTPIFAAFDGKVRFVKGGYATGGYGTLVIIRHDNGLETFYGHLSKALVKAGEIVKAGEKIALGGNTGRSTGAHLHFEVRYEGQSFDPERLFDFKKGELRDSMICLKKSYYSIYSHYGQTDAESLAASKHIRHKIHSGDTLGGLARRYSTTTNNICRLNRISRSTILRIGRSLIVR